jgi:predicted PhzF superfamily epimerase YddE/YHI9
VTGTCHVVSVFVGEDGGGGNPLGVFLDGGEVSEARRQPIATELGFSETVFLEDAARGDLRMFTPAQEIRFAGHPLVGTAWLLRRERSPVELLRPPPGEVRVRYDGDRTWIAARPEWSVTFDYVQLGSPAEVDALEEGPTGRGDDYCWAWEDEAEGTVRARSFAPAYGIPEDEATGSAALTLSARLGRSLIVHQGNASLITTRLLDDGFVEVGGRTEPVEVRELSIR